MGPVLRTSFIDNGALARVTIDDRTTRRIYDDGYGGIVEGERPAELRLGDDVATELPVWDQSRWTIVEQAKQSILFETPVTHFLVRAFLAEGVDEFLAHLTTVEAALGLRRPIANWKIVLDKTLISNMLLRPAPAWSGGKATFCPCFWR